MARRNIITRPIAENTDMVSPADFGLAPFVLLVEFVPPKRTLLLGGQVYRIKLQIKLRDAAIYDLLGKFKLLGVVVHTDGRSEDIEKARGETISQMEVALQQWNPVGLLQSMWGFGAKTYAGARAVEVTVERLLHVVEIEADSMDEATFIAHQVRSNIDKLAAKIASAKSFEEGGEVRVYVPGEKMKPVKDKAGTRPSDWGR